MKISTLRVLGCCTLFSILSAQDAEEEEWLFWDDPIGEIDEQIAELDYMLSAASVAGAESIPSEDTDASLFASSFLDVSANISAGFGFSSNPSLAEEGISSAVAALEGDLFVTWIPDLRHEAGVFVLYEQRYYGAPEIEDQEITLLAQASYAWKPGAWTWRGEANYLYARQFYDATDLVGGRGVELLELQEPQVDLSLRRDLRRDWYVRTGGQGAIGLYDDGTDDYRAYAGELALGRESSLLEGWEVFVRVRRLEYEERPAASLIGLPLPGTTLETTEYRLGGFHSIGFGAAQAWRMRTDVYFEVREDNGSGYYDQNRFSLRERLTWRAGDFRATLSGGLLYVAYTDRTVSILVDEKVEQLKLDGGLRLEWSLSPLWRLRAEYNFSRFDSNSVGEDYTVHTAIASIGMSF